jgi:radical SAM protein with 4Fe4S-binding SPASM domain
VLNLIPKKNDAVLACRIIEGQAVIVDSVHGTLNTLNATASRIWELLEGNISAKKIAEKITEEFEVAFDEAIGDVVETLQGMASMGWVSDFPCDKAFVAAENNKGRKLFEALREQATLKKIPLVVHFDLTYRCPLRCVHCYLTDGKKCLECTTNEIKHILVQLADAGCLYLTFSGGEIFLRNDLPEIVAFARKLHFAVRLLTSGVLIDTEKAKEIAAWHPEMVAFSVYDLDASVHDTITGKKGSLAKTMDAIHALKDEGVPLKISSVLMDRNVDSYRKVYRLAKKLGAQFQADYRITPKIDGSKKPLEFHISEQQVKQLLSDPVFSREYEPEPAEGYSGIFNTIPCGAGHMSCYISPYGVVTPCVQVPIDCGNLREKTFLEIWKNSSALETFRAIRFADMPACVNCELFAYCRPCPGLNLVETGNIATPPQRVCSEAEYMKTLKKKRR